MKFWIKLQHWFYRMLIDYKTKKIIEFNNISLEVSTISPTSSKVYFLLILYSPYLLLVLKYFENLTKSPS